jgi:hypothetical protein
MQSLLSSSLPRSLWPFTVSSCAALLTSDSPALNVPQQAEEVLPCKKRLPATSKTALLNVLQLFLAVRRIEKQVCGLLAFLIPSAPRYTDLLATYKTRYRQTSTEPASNSLRLRFRQTSAHIDLASKDLWLDTSNQPIKQSQSLHACRLFWYIQP